MSELKSKKLSEQMKIARFFLKTRYIAWYGSENNIFSFLKTLSLLRLMSSDSPHMYSKMRQAIHDAGGVEVF